MADQQDAATKSFLKVVQDPNFRVPRLYANPDVLVTATELAVRDARIADQTEQLEKADSRIEKLEVSTAAACQGFLLPETQSGKGSDACAAFALIMRYTATSPYAAVSHEDQRRARRRRDLYVSNTVVPSRPPYALCRFMIFLCLG